MIQEKSFIEITNINLRYHCKGNSLFKQLVPEISHIQLQRKEIAEDKNSKPTFTSEEAPEEKEALAPVFTSGIGTSLKNNIEINNSNLTPKQVVKKIIKEIGI